MVTQISAPLNHELSHRILSLAAGHEYDIVGTSNIVGTSLIDHITYMIYIVQTRTIMTRLVTMVS